MEHIELVDRLKEKANVSYEEAKTALEQSDWDLLEAIILLEKQGKVTNGQETGEYSTKGRENRQEEHYDARRDTVGIGDIAMKCLRWFGKIVKICNNNNINATRAGEKVLSLPITAFVLLMIVGFWAVVPVMIVGLFFGFSYSVSGPNLGRDDVNDVIGKATKVAENIKDEFKAAKDARNGHEE